MRTSKLRALVEQGFFSAGNFLVLLAAARHLGVKDWGTLSFGVAFILFLQGLQRSVVIVPMNLELAAQEMAGQRTGKWLALHFVTVCIALLVGLAVAFVAFARQVEWLLYSAAFVVVAISPIFFSSFIDEFLFSKVCNPYSPKFR